MREKDSPEMMPRAVICDIDGTLVWEKQKLPSARVLRALEQIHARGVLVIAATGRIRQLIPDGLLRLADYCVCGNGGLVTDQAGQVLQETPFDRDLVEELTAQFPGLDCGCCGAPSCRALAEDIVRGLASRHFCIHILRDHIHTLSDTCADMIADVVAKNQECSQERIQALAGQLDQLNTEIAMMDVGHRPAACAVPAAQEEGGDVYDPA